MKPYAPTLKSMGDNEASPHELASKELTYLIGLSECRNWESQFVYTSIEVEEAIGAPENTGDVVEYNKIVENWHQKKVASIDQQILRQTIVNFML